MRRKLVVGNWKMFKTIGQSVTDFLCFAENTHTIASKIDIGIAAPALSLASLAQKNMMHVGLYAQNCHWEKEGAFTGEISYSMLQDLSIKGSIIGHSERRQYFAETNQTAGKRVGALLKSHQQAIFCIGETLSQRESGQLESVIKAQLVEGFNAAVVTADELMGSCRERPLLSVAYEPVWAIGTGKAATPVEAEAAHAYTRKILAELFGTEIAERICILYGGSVNSQNAAAFMQCRHVDGALVGGASLKPDAFTELCKIIAG